METEDTFAKLAERHIQQAIDDGEFDDLPGKGKPIVFDDDPLTPAHRRLVGNILKNANVLPDWVQLQTEIAADRDEAARLLGRLLAENHARQSKAAKRPRNHPDVAVYAAWRERSRAEYLRILKRVNTGILKVNVMAPPSAAPLIPYRIDEDMQEFDREFEGLP